MQKKKRKTRFSSPPPLNSHHKHYQIIRRSNKTSDKHKILSTKPEKNGESGAPKLRKLTGSKLPSNGDRNRRWSLSWAWGFKLSAEKWISSFSFRVSNVSPARWRSKPTSVTARCSTYEEEKKGMPRSGCGSLLRIRTSRHRWIPDVWSRPLVTSWQIK